MHIASRLGDLESIRLLISNGADCDLLTRDHYTPLHVAAKEGYDDVIKLLLEHGAKQNIKTKVEDFIAYLMMINFVSFWFVNY